MRSIPQLAAFTARQTQTTVPGAISNTNAASPAHAADAGEAQTSAKAQVSSLSRLLSDAATRAAARDASTSRDGLAAIARFAVEKLFGEHYTRNKAADDAEVPNSDDPQRLAQARQATDFTNGNGTNPFKGMSREQLALIAYDDSGAFTINERRAAWSEADDQEQMWKRAIIAKMNDEYHRTGKVSARTHQAVLDHYKALPAIEEAQLPTGYDTQLQAWIQQAQGAESTQHKGVLQFPLLTRRLDMVRG